MNIDQKKIRFITLANKRVNKALKQISLVNNLSNKNNYEYTKDEVKQIIEALENEIKKCKDSFERQLKEKKEKFSIK